MGWTPLLIALWLPAEAQTISTGAVYGGAPPFVALTCNFPEIWNISSPSFSPNGKSIAVCTLGVYGKYHHPTLVIWDVGAEQLRARINTNELPGDPGGGQIFNVAFSHDGKRLIYTGWSGDSIRVLDLKTNEVTKTMPGGNGPDKYHSQSGLLASCDCVVRPNKLYLAEPLHKREVSSFLFPKSVSCCRSAAFSREASWLAFGLGSDKSRSTAPYQAVLVLNPRNLEEPCYLPTEGPTCGAVAFAPDRNLLAYSDGDKQQNVVLYNLDKKEEQATLRGQGKELQGLAFTPDGRWLIGGYYDGHVIIWDLSRKQILTRFRAHEEVRYLAISPDGTRLATSCCRELKLWYLDKFRESFEQR